MQEGSLEIWTGEIQHSQSQKGQRRQKQCGNNQGDCVTSVLIIPPVDKGTELRVRVQPGFYASQSLEYFCS